jgi:alpha-glucosidase/alpha-D-xyloside xylohydrolase
MNGYYIDGTKVKLCFDVVSEKTLRICTLPQEFSVQKTFSNIDLADRLFPEPTITVIGPDVDQKIIIGSFSIYLDEFEIEIFRNQRRIQHLSICPENGIIRFGIKNQEALFGLGQGYESSFNRRGGVYDLSFIGKQSGFLKNHCSYAPSPFVIGEGWAIFFHQPWKGYLDLRGEQGVFGKDPKEYSDIFVIDAKDPLDAAVEYYNLTGLPPLPPKYAFGYQQSFRTLLYHGQERVWKSAHYMRTHDLPCDVLIFLGTGFCDSGWNTGHGKFDWNHEIFSEPEADMRNLHGMGYKISLHVIGAPNSLRGEIGETVDISPLEKDHVKNYWAKHQKLYETARNEMWWPDAGDDLDIRPRLARQRMYYEGSVAAAPGKRPFAMHRNASPGHTKWGGILWSGDVMSTWDSLKTQVSIGINVGMSLTPYWGSDTGGFFCSKEFSGELYLRWFEYNTFTPFLRSHGRMSFLHTPWGWGEFQRFDDIPNENGSRPEEQLPLAETLGDERVEPICRKYIHERYTLLPYIYTLAWEASSQGLPMMRPLWACFPGDIDAQTENQEYMFGRNLLVAPVVEKGVLTRLVYLPDGEWYDYWSKKKNSGSQKITSPCPLNVIPLYVPAGGILVKAPVVPYVSVNPSNNFDEIYLEIYTGADGQYTLYEDDGLSFNYQRGNYTITRFSWNDSSGILNGTGYSGLFPGGKRTIKVVLYPSGEEKVFRIDYLSNRLAQ